MSDAFRGTACVTRLAGAFSLSAWVTGGASGGPKPHGHAEAHFMYVPGDAGYVTDARGERAGNGAHLIFNPAGTYHADRLTRPGRFFAIAVEQDFDLPLPRHPTQLGRPRAHGLAAKLMRGTGGEDLCLELMATMLDDERTSAPPPWLDRATQMLRDDFTRDVSVGEIAREADVHPVHLARAFRAHTGHSPSEYLHHVRVEHAALLLSATALSVAEIALECGFADQSHLTKRFRRAFGTPPAAYRRLTGTMFRLDKTPRPARA